MNALVLGLLMTATPAETAAQNKALVQQSFEKWRAGTGGPFDLLTEDAKWTITGSSIAAGTYDSKEAFMRDVIRPFNARLKVPLKPTIKGLHAEGDTVIVHFDGVATAKDGVAYRNTYAWFLELHGGKVTKVTAFYDSIAFDTFWRRVSP